MLKYRTVIACQVTWYNKNNIKLLASLKHQNPTVLVLVDYSNSKMLSIPIIVKWSKKAENQENFLIGYKWCHNEHKPHVLDV